MCHSKAPRCPTCNRRNNCHRRNCTTAFALAQPQTYHLTAPFEVSTSAQAPVHNCCRKQRCSSCNRKGNCHRRNCAVAYPVAQASQLPPSYDTAINQQQSPSVVYVGPAPARGCCHRRKGHGPIGLVVGPIGMGVRFVIQKYQEKQEREREKAVLASTSETGQDGDRSECGVVDSELLLEEYTDKKRSMSEKEDLEVLDEKVGNLAL